LYEKYEMRQALSE